MKQTENFQSIIKEVEKKKEDIAFKNTEILTLQHHNVVLQEQTYIQKDKYFMLDTEFQDRKRIFENLYIKYKKKNQNMVDEEFDEGDIDESVIGIHKKGKLNIKQDDNPTDEDRERKNQPEISDLRVLEGIQNYLDKQIIKYDRYRMVKQLNFSPSKNKNGQGNNQENNTSSCSSSSSEDSDLDNSNNQGENQGKSKKKQNQNVFNPFKCIQVRFKSMKQGDIAEGQKVVVSFRVEEKTKFNEIKRAACQYWQVKDPNSKEVNGILTQALIKDDTYSFMDLCDETNSTLPDNQQVIQFLLQKGYKNLGQCTLVLRQKDFRTGLESQQNECTKISKGTDQQKQQGQYYVTRVQVNQINPNDQFFQEYPSLKYYIELKRLQESEQQTGEAIEEQMVLQQGVNDTHCCIIMFILMIITVTGLFLTNMLDVEIKYQSHQYFANVLKLDTSFDSLDSSNLFEVFVKNILGDSFFDSTIYTPYQAYFKDNFEMIGNLRLRFQRQQLKECEVFSNIYSKYSCFDTDSIELIKTDIGNNQKYCKHYSYSFEIAYQIQ